MKDLSGLRFGKLTAIAINGTTSNGRAERVATWLCRCDCGRERTVSAPNLTRARVSHCDRRRRIPRGIEYNSYSAMKARCYQASNKEFANYGGRGIRVCGRWVDGAGCSTGFECFLADMGQGPSSQHSIERKDANGNYEPDNCRWATTLEQVRNRRSTRTIKFGENRIPIAEAAERTGIPYDTLLSRLDQHGWSEERALTPIQSRPVAR